MDEAGSQGLVQLVEVILSGCRQGGQRPAMEAVLKSHDGVAVRTLLLGGVLSRRLDGALVGLGTGIGKEHLLHAGFLAQKLGKPGTGRIVIEI